MNIKPYVKEILFTICVYAWFLFVATNVNITLGQTYLHFTLGSLVLLVVGITVFDKNLRITFQNKSGGTIQAIGYGIAGWAILLIVSSLVMKYVSPAQSSIGSILGLLYSSTPALASSKVANFITFGIAIAYIETQLWARMMEFF